MHVTKNIILFLFSYPNTTKLEKSRKYTEYDNYYNNNNNRKAMFQQPSLQLQAIQERQSIWPTDLTHKWNTPPIRKLALTTS